MLSSDKFPDWNTFFEREVPFTVELLAPASEVSAMLQRYSAALDGTRQAGEEICRAGIMALVQQANYVFRLATVLNDFEASPSETSLQRVHRTLRIIKDQMHETLRDNGIEIEDPLGRRFDEVVDRVEVQGWRHDLRFAYEVVAEVRDPIVTCHGALVQFGRVVIGAPPQEDEG